MVAGFHSRTKIKYVFSLVILDYHSSISGSKVRTVTSYLTLSRRPGVSGQVGVWSKSVRVEVVHEGPYTRVSFSTMKSTVHFGPPSGLPAVHESQRVPPQVRRPLSVQLQLWVRPGTRVDTGLPLFVCSTWGSPWTDCPCGLRPPWPYPSRNHPGTPLGCTGLEDHV